MRCFTFNIKEVAIPKFQEVTLETVCDGSAKELFGRALKEVLDNIQDVNTDPEATRKIALIFAFEPSEDRASSNITLKCEVKPAPVASIGSSLFITKEQGVRKAYASTAKQEPLFPQEMDQEKTSMTS